MDLTNATTMDLVTELQRRCVASAMVLKLIDTPPETNIHLRMNALKDEVIGLLGLADILHDDVRQAVRAKLMAHPKD